MSGEEKKAQELLKQANSALTRWSFFSSSSKYEDAGDLFVKAANFFKMAKNWEAAGDAYKCKAECDEKLGSMYEAATNYVTAGDAYKNIDPQKAITFYEKAIALFGETGKFGTAAKTCETIAETYEQDMKLEEAVAKFQQAADYYAGENSKTRANKCLAKVAAHSATLFKYAEAVKIFEQLGMDSLNNNLLKFNAKKYFLHAGFCTLARSDTVAARQAVQKYSEMDYTFSGSREQTLLESLVNACEEFDAQQFATDLHGYDSMTKLTPWETTILLRVKKSIESNENETEDLR